MITLDNFVTKQEACGRRPCEKVWHCSAIDMGKTLLATNFAVSATEPEISE